MRGIKFRAWDSIRNVMYEVYELDLVNQLARYDWNYEGRYGAEQYNFPVKLMQYTGLKDRNGKEIYEGDILKDDLGGPYRGAVRWIEDWAMFGVQHDKLESLNRWASVSEVVGNIYEHPHLLKEE